MLTLEGTLEAAEELEQAGTMPANLKYALWTAMLSAQKSLTQNGRQSRVLAQYAEAGLPEAGPEALLAEMRRAGCGFLTRKQAQCLYDVETLWNAGELDRFTVRPRIGSRIAWMEWRESLLQVLKGKCFSRKTISMAALLMWPVESLLVPVDRHVMARLGYDREAYESSSRNRKLYLEAENTIWNEWTESESWAPFMVWHWYKWEEYRRSIGASNYTTEQPESHIQLSCHWY